jgi:hypothetical protein
VKLVFFSAKNVRIFLGYQKKATIKILKKSKKKGRLAKSQTE